MIEAKILGLFLLIIGVTRIISLEPFESFFIMFLYATITVFGLVLATSDMDE